MKYFNGQIVKKGDKMQGAASGTCEVVSEPDCDLVEVRNVRTGEEWELGPDHLSQCDLIDRGIPESFKVHTGEIITGDRLLGARRHAASWKRVNARAIRKDDPYASHVTEGMKEDILKESLVHANEIEAGKHDGNFTIWQRMNEFITGECVALLPNK